MKPASNPERFTMACGQRHDLGFAFSSHDDDGQLCLTKYFNSSDVSDEVDVADVAAQVETVWHATELLPPLRLPVV
jgi:hypothetical protein